MDSDLGLVVTEMNNNNRNKRIKPDDLKANYRDKFVSSGDEEGGDGSIVWSVKSMGRGCYMIFVNAKDFFFFSRW